MKNTVYTQADHCLFGVIHLVSQPEISRPLGHRCFIFCFTDFFHKNLGSEEEMKIKLNFPTELKSKETRFCVSFDFNSIGKWSE